MIALKMIQNEMMKQLKNLLNSIEISSGDDPFITV